MLDVLVNCFVAYEGPDGNFVTDRWKILHHYATTWMPLDVLGSFPFDWCADFPPAVLRSRHSGDSEGSELSVLTRTARLTRLTRLLKLLRLLRLVRLAKVHFMLRGSSTTYDDGLPAFVHLFGTIFRYLFGFALFAHVVACVEFFLAYVIWPGGWVEEWLPGSVAGDREGNTWVFQTYLLPTYGSTLYVPRNEEEDTRYLEMCQLYSAAIFHAVGQLVGLHTGLASPQVAPEFWVSTIVTVAGTAIYAAFLGVIAASLQERYASARAHRTTMNKVVQFVDHAKLNDELAKKLRLYFTASNPSGSSLKDDEEEMFARVSPALRRDLKLHLYEPAIKALRVRGDLAGSVADRLQRAFHLFGDILIREGQAQRADLHIIVSGQVKLWTAVRAARKGDDRGSTASSMAKSSKSSKWSGSGSGEENKKYLKSVVAKKDDVAIFGEMSLLNNQPPACNIEVDLFCEGFLLAVSDFDALCAEGARFRDHLKRLQRARMAELETLKNRDSFVAKTQEMQDQLAASNQRKLGTEREFIVQKFVQKKSVRLAQALLKASSSDRIEASASECDNSRRSSETAGDTSTRLSQAGTSKGSGATESSSRQLSRQQDPSTERAPAGAEDEVSGPTLQDPKWKSFLRSGHI